MSFGKNNGRKGNFYELDSATIPSHVAIIMDGNRRWAAKRGLSPTQGHAAGAKNLVKIVNYAEKIGIKYLTVYALSTENWRKRAKEEVKGLFDLLIRTVKEKAEEYKKRGVKFFVLGNFQAFPLRVRQAISKILEVVKEKERIKLNVALNYGGRDELVRAFQLMIKDGVKPSQVNEELISKYLDTKGQPDPDLIIRTGGEIRLSNFLIWQMSYAELYFTDILWPDFGPKQLEEAIFEYQRRQRRFGK